MKTGRVCVKLPPVPPALRAAALGSFLPHLHLKVPLPGLFFRSAVPRQGATISFGLGTEMCLSVSDKLRRGSGSGSLAPLSVVLPSSSLWCPAKKPLGCCQIPALAWHLHSVGLCTKQPCIAKAAARSCRKDLSEVITNQAEKYQKEMCNMWEKLCLLQAAGALPTRRFNCSNANPQR